MKDETCINVPLEAWNFNAARQIELARLGQELIEAVNMAFEFYSGPATQFNILQHAIENFKEVLQ